MKLPTRVSRIVPDTVADSLADATDWRRRTATLVSAVLIGLVAILFAEAGDAAARGYRMIQQYDPYVAMAFTPLVFVLVAYVMNRIAPEARGSGIPQVIAASRYPGRKTSRMLVSLRGAVAKVGLTLAALFGGASVGREGPTVQLAAAVMVQVHRFLKVRVTAGVYIAGGAAGVAAAFNTPLAGIAFAIEELAVAYEQRLAVLVMGAVMIAGLTAQGIAGDYAYFGQIDEPALSVGLTLLAAGLAGIGGGLLGGLFSRWLLALRGPGGRFASLLKKRPLVTALVCGLIVAGLSFATAGATAGTGYIPTRIVLEGGHGSMWFGPAKFLATLATSASGIAGGIFAPSLAVGAGFGNLLTPLFPDVNAGTIVIVGMAGYFSGVVRAPLTTVIILSEATGGQVLLPLFATALLGDWVAAMVCKQRLYHALSKDFDPKPAVPAT